MEPIVHILIPLAFLLAIFPKLNRKQVLLFSILAILPDFDFLIGHRAPLHNIFALAIIATIFLIFTGKKAALLSLYFYGSHILFDLTSPGVAFLYPLTNKLFKVNFILSTNPANIFDLTSKIVLQSFTEATKAQAAPYLKTQGILFLVLVIILIIAYFLKKR